jgi:hypothetical protein
LTIWQANALGLLRITGWISSVALLSPDGRQFVLIGNLEGGLAAHYNGLIRIDLESRARIVDLLDKGACNIRENRSSKGVWLSPAGNYLIYGLQRDLGNGARDVMAIAKLGGDGIEQKFVIPTASREFASPKVFVGDGEIIATRKSNEDVSWLAIDLAQTLQAGRIVESGARYAQYLANWRHNDSLYYFLGPNHLERTSLDFARVLGRSVLLGYTTSFNTRRLSGWCGVLWLSETSTHHGVRRWDDAATIYMSPGGSYCVVISEDYGRKRVEIEVQSLLHILQKLSDKAMAPPRK